MPKKKETANTKKTTQEKKMILVVDDKAENRHLLEAMLIPNGYTVVSASNGIDALKLIREEPFDAIISDLLMPKMDGFQLIRECKKDPALQKIPFIIYTATYTGKKDIDFGLSLGAVRYIIKPTEPYDFLRILNGVLAGIRKDEVAAVIPKITDDTVYSAEHIRALTEKLEKKILALEKSEKNYRALFENANDAIVVHGFTPDGLPSRFTDVNENTCRLFGYSRDEMLTMSPLDIDAPETWEEARDHAQKLREDGHLVFEGTQVKKDGQRFPVEVSAHIFTLDDHIVILSIIRDITERKRAEEALQESEERYRVLAETSSDIIFIHDLNCAFSYMNQTGLKTIGITLEEIVGKNNVNIFPPAIASEQQRMVSKVIAKKQPVSAELEIQIREERRWFDSILMPLMAEDGSVRAVMGSVRDVTERKQVEEAIHQANRKLNLLSSITRHDILNQLMALKGYLELSEDVIDKPETLREFIKKEQQAANTIEHQITFTKVYQELGAAAPAWQNANAKIQKAVGMLPMRDVRVEVDPKNPDIFADPLFEKVFYNLIDNAIRYGGDQMKTIRVFSQESDSSLMIICKDDGVGISAEDKKRLFTRGFGKNTGLGLFLSREILAITGITITENGTPGKSARFEITVPKGAYRFRVGG